MNSLVFAAEAKNITCRGLDCDICHILETISQVLNWLLLVSLTAATLSLIIGGLSYIISRDREQWIIKARGKIRGVIISFGLILFSWLIIYAAFWAIGITERGSWWKVNCQIKESTVYSHLPVKNITSLLHPENEGKNLSIVLTKSTKAENINIFLDNISESDRATFKVGTEHGVKLLATFGKKDKKIEITKINEKLIKELTEGLEKKDLSLGSLLKRSSAENTNPLENKIDTLAKLIVELLNEDREVYTVFSKKVDDTIKTEQCIESGGIWYRFQTEEDLEEQKCPSSLTQVSAYSNTMLDDCKCPEHKCLHNSFCFDEPLLIEGGRGGEEECLNSGGTWGDARCVTYCGGEERCFSLNCVMESTTCVHKDCTCPTGKCLDSKSNTCVVDNDVNNPTVSILFPKRYESVNTYGFIFSGTARNKTEVSEIRVYLEDGSNKGRFTVSNELAEFDKKTGNWKYFFKKEDLHGLHSAYLHVRAISVSGKIGNWEWIPIHIGYDPKRSSNIKYINPQVPNVSIPAYRGTRYQVEVPDTLDLAERAALSVNGLTNSVDPENDYEVYWTVKLLDNKPVMSRSEHGWQIQTQMEEALPLMRLISGNMQNMHVEQRWLEVKFQSQGPDGVHYYPVEGRPWAWLDSDYGQKFKGDQYFSSWSSASYLGLLAYYYSLTHDEKYLKYGQEMVDGIARKVVHHPDGYAYYTKYFYDLGEDGTGEISPKNAEFPSKEDYYYLRANIGWNIRYLVKFFKATGYEPAIELAGEFTKFLRNENNKHGFIGQDGHWTSVNGSTAHNAGYLIGLVEYALLTKDQELLEWTHNSFKNRLTENVGIMQMGFFPEYPSYSDQTGKGGETCQVASMLDLAIKFSSAGVGDYWDDADRWVRNHFAESQMQNSSWMYATDWGRSDYIGEWPDDPRHAKCIENPEICNMFLEDNDVGLKNIGNFASWPKPNDGYGNEIAPQQRVMMHCCTGVGNLALYRVWKNILHHSKDGQLKVNLLLNRASPWADVNSYIPYIGRVDIRMKTTADLSIRIPEWISESAKNDQVRCTVNNVDHPFTWEGMNGRYARVGNVASSDVITLTFPIFERTEVVENYGDKYTIIRRGNEVVDIDPKGTYWPYYQRPGYRNDKPLFKTTERFVVDGLIQY